MNPLVAEDFILFVLFMIACVLILMWLPRRKKEMDLRTLSWIMSDGGRNPFELTGFDKDGNEVLTVKYKPPPEEELDEC